MATAIEASTNENSVSATATTQIVIPQQLQQAAQTQASQAAAQGGAQVPQAPLNVMALPGVNAADWIAANRIHVKDGSLFIDPYLVLHPRELDPAHEAALRKKLELTYSIDEPSFFEGDRMAVALNLGQVIPPSLPAKRSKLLEQIDTFNRELAQDTDTELKKTLDAKHAPFAALVREVTERPAEDPLGTDLLKNSLGMYLLLREKMTQNGYLKSLTDYVQRRATPDQVLAELADKVGASPLAIREAAYQGGLPAVGQLLGLDARYIAEVQQFTEQAATREFSNNLVEHWYLGHQLRGLNVPTEELLATGKAQRINDNIAKFRAQVHHHYDVPEPIKREEARIAESLSLLEPIQRASMFQLGYEVCFSPEVTADGIAFHPGIYGVNRKAANSLRDVVGTYRIYFSGRGSLKDSSRTEVHEGTHNLWPAMFSPAQVQAIDRLAQSDAERFAHFQAMMEAHFSEFEQLFNSYKAAPEAQKAQILAAADARFAPYDFHAEGLFPYLRDAHDFQFAVKHCYDTLRIEGARYSTSGYHSAEERFREVISRFSELKLVEYRGEPEFMQFLAPGLNQVWEAHYLPHLEKVYQEVARGNKAPAFVPPYVGDNAGTVVGYTAHGPLVLGAPLEAHTANLNVTTASSPQSLVDARSITMTPQVASALQTLGMRAN